MRLKNYTYYFVLFCVASLMFQSCSGEDLSQDIETTQISIKFKSIVENLDEVYLDIADVQIKVAENEADTGVWKSLNAINLGIYNTSEFREASALLLVDNLKIEANYVHEIRLVFGENNFMNIGNILHSLDLENALPSNLVKTKLNSSRKYDVTIDIDIDESVRFNEDENMMVLSPKIYTAIRQIQY